MHLNNSIRYKRSFVNINPQSNTDFTQVTCTVNFYYTVKKEHSHLLFTFSSLKFIQVFQIRSKITFVLNIYLTFVESSLNLASNKKPGLQRYFQSYLFCLSQLVVRKICMLWDKFWTVFSNFFCSFEGKCFLSFWSFRTKKVSFE
jgi:hypothetical protein